MNVPILCMRSDGGAKPNTYWAGREGVWHRQPGGSGGGGVPGKSGVSQGLLCFEGAQCCQQLVKQMQQ